MKKSKGMQLGAMLAALLLVVVAVVPGVLAQPDDRKGGAEIKSNNDIVIKGKEVKENTSEKYYGKGDGQLLTYSPSKGEISIQSWSTWEAYTDLYNAWWSNIPELNTYSKSRDSNGLPADISKIEVRGRVWKSDVLTFDNTDTHYNSADASIYWKSGCTGCSGHYLARGNHVFEDGSDSWYPVTQDTLDT